MFEKEIKYLKEKDEKLRAVIEECGEVDFSWSGKDHFRTLVQSIVYQQLASKAARTIFKRLEEKTSITPNRILKADLDGVGLSNQKKEYIKDLAEKFVNKKIRTDFENMTDEEVIRELTRIKGVGSWTAEMFLMFSLKRLNVFSNSDLGLRKAVQKLYGLPSLPKEKELGRITEKWSPYKTIAALYLWKWLD